MNNSIKRLSLTTSAIAIAILSTIATPAMADKNHSWNNLKYVQGSGTSDTAILGTTNITQNGRIAIAETNDANIYQNHTVNIINNSNDIFAIRAKGTNSPTNILGALNANGKVFILDNNGIIFGKNSTINVGSLIATSGNISNQDIINDGSILITDINGDININNGAIINIHDTGLAAFIGKNINSNGTINANIGQVILASGTEATLDMYGDQLIEISAGSLIKHSGKINAQKGQVQITVGAAKSAIDNLINTSNIETASNATISNGKIILSGDINAGTDINITADNIEITKDSTITNSENNANTYIYGNKKTSFKGHINSTGKEAFVEVSGRELSLGGTIDISKTGTVSFDPVSFTINAAEASTIESSLLGGGIVNVEAEETITLNAAIDTSSQTNSARLHFADQGGADGLTVNLNNKITLGNNQGITGEATTINISSDGNIQNGIDISKDYPDEFTTINVASGTFEEDLSMRASKSIFMNGANSSNNPSSPSRSEESIITGTINIDNNTASIAGFTISNEVTATQNFAGILSIRNNIFKNINGNALNIIGSNHASISSNLFESITGIAINMQDTERSQITTNIFKNINGTAIHSYRSINNLISHNRFEDITGNAIESIEEFYQTIRNNSFHTIDGHAINISRGSENKITQNTFDNIDGNGISLVYSSDSLVAFNLINNSNEGIYLYRTDNNTISNNTIEFTRDNGIHGIEGFNTVYTNNVISNTGLSGILLNKYTGHELISVNNNHISNTGTYGIFTKYSDVSLDNNIISYTNSDGIKIWKSDALILNNNITYTGRNGIFLDLSRGMLIENNDIDMTTNSGIRITNSLRSDLLLNTIKNTYGDGISIKNSTGLIIEANDINGTVGRGIFITGSEDAEVKDNIIFNTGSDGIKTWNSSVNFDSNSINITGRHGLYIDKSSFHPSDYPYIVNNKIGITSGSGLKITNSDNYSIIDNEITHTGKHGIEINKTSDLFMDNNIISNSSRDGINIKRSDNAFLISNKIYDSSDSGLKLDGAFNKTLSFSENIFLNNKTGAYIKSGILNNSWDNIYAEGEIGLRLSPQSLNGTDPNLIGSEYGISYEEASNMEFAKLEITSDFIEDHHDGHIQGNFLNNSKYDIYLSNNALNRQNIFSATSDFDGAKADYNRDTDQHTISLADYNTIESKIYHSYDNPSLGTIYFGDIK